MPGADVPECLCGPLGLGLSHLPVDHGVFVHLPEGQAYDKVPRRSGHLIGTGSPQPARESTTVRAGKGNVSITDGLFAESKEQLAGFYLVEAKDLNEAIQLAARIPPARVGSIEVRPIRPIREMAAQTEPPQPKR